MINEILTTNCTKQHQLVLAFSYLRDPRGIHRIASCLGAGPVSHGAIMYANKISGLSEPEARKFAEQTLQRGRIVTATAVDRLCEKVRKIIHANC